MLKRVSILLVLMAVLAAACGDDDGGSADEQAVATALVAQIRADSAAGEPFADAAASQCLANGLVSAFGLSRMAELGVTADSVATQEAFFGGMTDAEISDAVDISFGCADFGAVFAGQFPGLSSDSASCFAAALMDSGFLKAATTAQLRGEEFDPSGDPEAVAQISGAAQSCFSDAELTTFFGG